MSKENQQHFGQKRIYNAENTANSVKFPKEYSKQQLLQKMYYVQKHNAQCDV